MKMIVWVGGDLPESAIPELVETLQDDRVQMIDGWGVEQDPIETLIRDFQEPNSIELEYDVDYEMDGSVAVTLELDDFCEKHGLTYKKLLPPAVNSSEEHHNECYFYWKPGMTPGPECIPTDGEGEIVMKQSDVLELFDTCWALSLCPLSDMPLLINDKDDVTRLYAKDSLAGRHFNEIFKELLVSRIGHEEVGCPPFVIIKGR